MNGQMDGRTDGISPHSIGLRPLLGPLPKKNGIRTRINYCEAWVEAKTLIYPSTFSEYLTILRLAESLY